ncbi:hypothetical protein ACLIIZ_03135 [Azonexus caeni]|uniref:hypothetical protein n=1 Tax=Azonexus caeni TaxID=266126 RepID=UPI003A88496D
MKREEITPLFRSGHDACRFAYAYSSQQYAMTALAKMMKGGPCGSGRGLVGLDGAAIAGTVKRYVESMSFPAPLAIACRHELNREKLLQYAMLLVQFVMPALGTGGHNRRMVHALVCLYFGIRDANGHKIKLADLCDKYDMSADTMTRRKSAAFKRLREIESAAQVAIDERLKDGGLVE